MTLTVRRHRVLLAKLEDFGCRHTTASKRRPFGRAGTLAKP